MQRKSWISCLQVSLLMGVLALCMGYMVLYLPEVPGAWGQIYGLWGFAIGALLFAIASVTTGVTGAWGFLDSGVQTLCHRLRAR